MILFACSSSRETAALIAVCDHRNWAAYGCTTIREFKSLTERIKPRAIVVRHRLLDGYSDDIFAQLKLVPATGRPKVIVLMSADRSTQAEARQIALGADCVLHDPVRTDILLEYLARYRLRSERMVSNTSGPLGSFTVAGVKIYPNEHRIMLGKKNLHIAPQEVALLQILANAPDEVIPYPVLYAELFGRRFIGDTSNCRVLLCKVLASFQRLGVELKANIQVIPKSGYLYLSVSSGARFRSSRIKKSKGARPNLGSKARHAGRLAHH